MFFYHSCIVPSWLTQLDAWTDSSLNELVDSRNEFSNKTPRHGGKKEDPKSPVSHHKETHGRGDDIDADIPISEFKGPSIFHRAKEEIEALVDTIHSKKESDHEAESPKKEGGFRASIKGKLHKIRNRD
ncbi:hypothetical protein CTI12_AA457590 [Artemisia annua]|uniref:Uncharacterized protein n=1 Tax=Artemisia annua TaxID=35608 RepID=A0A2U1LT03_ARTAN|nr:hypothetical protein CTI12_AA457590 [Artemisia annua]